MPDLASLRMVRRRRVLLGAALVSVVAVLGVGCVYAWQSAARSERHRADDAITKYLRLVREHDRACANAMLCAGDDTSPVRTDANVDWHATRIDNLVIVTAWDWSSMVDGHGRTYRVRLRTADGSTITADFVVEIISDRACVGTEVPF
jgi:hypothetical protein